MRSAFRSSQPAPIKPVFVSDEVVCPLCESYEVAEGEHRLECLTCGTTWKTLKFGK